MEPEPSEARCPLDFRSYRKSCRKISHNVVIKNLRLLGRRHGTDVERSQHGTKGTKRKAGQPAFFVLVSQQENIMKKYSVYIRCSYEPLDSASPTIEKCIPWKYLQNFCRSPPHLRMLI